MVGQKRKYDEEDKIKAQNYYINNKEEIKTTHKKYREGLKNGNIPFAYSKNPNTKKAKMLKEKIEKINEKIRELEK